ncbi:MAG: BACON domain-containing protein [Alistipes sp.]|nr:BACON domain-containing protein [Alistipes sp.]
MKLRNLFYLLLALPLVFAACEEGSGDTDKAPEYKAELKLTSESTMEFPAEGGDGEISFTAEMVEVTRMSEQPMPKAECDADWVTDLAVGEKVTFKVAANEGDARETKVVVTYDTESFEVVIKQAKKADEPEKPAEPVAVTAVAFGGEYFSAAELEMDVDNYFFTLSDKPFTAEGDVDPTANAYAVDLYVAAYDGEWQENMTLPVGEYTLDTENSDAAGKFTGYLVLGAEDFAYSEAGKLVVTENGLTLTVTIDGVEHIVTYEGAMTLKNGSEKPIDTTVVELSHTMLYYYGDFYSPGEADNFIIILGDKGLTEEGWECEDGHYYKFDTYTECIDKTNGIAVPYGTYTLAAEYSTEVGVVASAAYYTGDWEVDEAITEGTLTVSADGFVAEVVINGQPYKLVCDGLNPVIVDCTENLGGDEEVISTLTDDVEVNITGATVVLDNLGDDYVWGCNNYLVYVSEDAAGETGEYMMFDILVPTTATTIAGTYQINDWEEPYTGFTGYYSDYDEEYYGCWYVNYDTKDMAPIYDAELKIEIAEDGTYTFTFDGVDDAGYFITGTIVGKEAEGGNEGGDESYSTLDEDLVFNITDATFISQDYGDGNYVLYIYEDLENEAGAFVMLEIFTPTGATDFAGEYTFVDTYEAYTSTPGYFYPEDEEWYGSVYVNMTTYDMAPLAGGSVTIAVAADGTHTFTFNSYDDAGNAITGTISGKLYGSDEGGEEGGEEGGDTPGASYENWECDGTYNTSTCVLTLTGLNDSQVIEIETTEVVTGYHRQSWGSFASVKVNGVETTDVSNDSYVNIQMAGVEFYLVLNGVKYTGTSRAINVE